jgi:hypothetical protein
MIKTVCATINCTSEHVRRAQPGRPGRRIEGAAPGLRQIAWRLPAGTIYLIDSYTFQLLAPSYNTVMGTGSTGCGSGWGRAAKQTRGVTKSGRNKARDVNARMSESCLRRSRVVLPRFLSIVLCAEEGEGYAVDRGRWGVGCDGRRYSCRCGGGGGGCS